MIMGYKNRTFILEEKHKQEVITKSGIILPTVLLNGRISARWKINGTKLTIVPFVKISKKNKSMIAAFGEKLFGGSAGVPRVVFE